MELIISIFVLLLAPIALITIFVVVIVYQLFICILHDERKIKQPMTRINSAILPRNLTDEHLLAEHREIKRICTFANMTYKNAPKEFTLGTGHVLFFVDKPAFTLLRYNLLYIECIRRGFNVEDYSPNWLIYKNIPDWPEYLPTERERQLLLERITSRLLDTPKPYWHYYGERISKDEAIMILNEA